MIGFNIVDTAIITLVVIGLVAIVYFVYIKKKDNKCSGCPYAKSCEKAKANCKKENK